MLVLLLISFSFLFFYLLYQFAFCTLLLISVSVFPFERIIEFKYSIISSTYSFLSPSHSMLNLFCIPFAIGIVLFFLALLSIPFSLQALAHSITAHCCVPSCCLPLLLRHRHTQMSECTPVACSNIEFESFPSSLALF